MVVLQFHVSPEVMREIRLEAERTGTDLSKVARKYLLKGLQEREEELKRIKNLGMAGAIATSFYVGCAIFTMALNLFGW